MYVGGIKEREMSRKAIKEMAVKWVVDNAERCLKSNLSAFQFAEQAYIAGSRVDPWHYPSKGELPKEPGEYFVLVRGLNGKPRPHIFEYSEGRWTFGENPICWQYIVLPKENEKWI